MGKSTRTTETAPDAASFDLTAFIEQKRVLTRPVLFKRADDLDARAADLQRQAERLAANPDAERGIDEPSAEQVQMLLDDLMAERERRGQPVTVREVTEREGQRIRARVIRSLTKAQRDVLQKGTASPDVDEQPGDEPTPMERVSLAQVAAGLVEPALSPDDLWTIYSSSSTGEAAVGQILAMIEEVSRVPDAPFSRASSPSPSTQGSAPN